MQYKISHGATGPRLEIRGDLDLSSAAQLCTAARDALDAVTEGPLSMDFSEVEFLDSTGIGALITARNEAESRGRKIAVVNPSLRSRQVLRVCGLAEEFGLATDTGSAGDR